MEMHCPAAALIAGLAQPAYFGLIWDKLLQSEYGSVVLALFEY